jgi:hypothetical protein
MLPEERMKDKLQAKIASLTQTREKTGSVAGCLEKQDK